MTTLVCFSDGSNAGMQYWMAEVERGRRSKVYKITWSSSAFLCTVRLCSSTPLHPPPSSVGPGIRLSLCCLACRPFCPPALGDINSNFWMFFLNCLPQGEMFTCRACVVRSSFVILCHGKDGSRVILEGKTKVKKRRTLMCPTFVGTALKEFVSLRSLHLQVRGSFQIPQGTRGRARRQSQGVHQRLHQELWR